MATSSLVVRQVLSGTGLLQVLKVVLLQEAKATIAMSLFLLTARKKAIIVSFRWDSSVLPAACIAGTAAVYHKTLVI